MNGRILFNGCEVTTAAELIARANALAARLSGGAAGGTVLYLSSLAGALESMVETLARDLEMAQTRDGSARTRRSLRERIAAADGDGVVRLDQRRTR